MPHHVSSITIPLSENFCVSFLTCQVFQQIDVAAWNHHSFLPTFEEWTRHHEVTQIWNMFFSSLRIMMEACHSQNFKKHLNFWLQVPHPATSLDGSKHQLWASILLWRLKSYRLNTWADRLSMQESTRERGLPRPAISIISHAQVLRWSFLDFHCPKVNGLLIFSRWLTLTAMVYSTSQSLLQ